jgi:hypothetical protein
MQPGLEARQAAAAHIAHLQHGPDGPGANTIIVGLLNLSMLMVMNLAKERGAGADDMLQRAGDILRDLSPRLPE